MEERPRFVNLKQVLSPIIGFLLFALGKILNLVHLLKGLDSRRFLLIHYIYLSIFVLTHLPLHLLLAIYENYLYQNLNLFHVICSWTLKTRFQEGFLKRAKLLLDVMEGIQGCFGFFILVDITLMLVYWLLHTYHAYFTCEVAQFIVFF